VKELETVEPAREAAEPDLPGYEPPTITVMNEEEVLSAFQITQAGITWWVA
jgi:hypothetical protein